jgi:hypothetical protein
MERLYVPEITRELYVPKINTNGFSKLTFDSPSRHFLSFYIGDYAGSYSGQKNPYLELIKGVRERAESEKLLVWGMDLTDFGEILHEEGYSNVLNKNVGQSVLIYPRIESNDSELMESTLSILNVLGSERVNFMFPLTELFRKRDLLRKEYQSIYKKTVVL